MYWEKNYTVVPCIGVQGILQMPLPSRVVDPANPANNVWESGVKGEDSSELIGKIDSIDLSQRYF